MVFLSFTPSPLRVIGHNTRKRRPFKYIYVHILSTDMHISSHPPGCTIVVPNRFSVHHNSHIVYLSDVCQQSKSSTAATNTLIVYNTTIDAVTIWNLFSRVLYCRRPLCETKAVYFVFAEMSGKTDVNHILFVLRR